MGSRYHLKLFPLNGGKFSWEGSPNVGQAKESNFPSIRTNAGYTLQISTMDSLLAKSPCRNNVSYIASGVGTLAGVGYVVLPLSG